MGRFERANFLDEMLASGRRLLAWPSNANDPNDCETASAYKGKHLGNLILNMTSLFTNSSSYIRVQILHLILGCDTDKLFCDSKCHILRKSC